VHCYSPLTPSSFLERSGRVYPGAAAIRELDRVISYGELLRRSRRLAAALKKLRVAYGDRVGLLAHNCREAIEANFGIPGAGGVLVSLNPWLPQDDIVEQLNWVGCRVAIVSSACLERYGRAALSNSGSRLLVVFGSPANATPHSACVEYEAIVDEASPDGLLSDAVQSELDPMVVNFTSGTTGTPKGVVMSHRAAYLHALGQVLMLGLERESRYLWTLPMFHVNGWGHVWANAVVGAGQVLAELPGAAQEDDARFCAQVRQAGITHLAGAPGLLRRILSLDGTAAALRGCTMVTGGAAPSQALLRRAEAAGVRLIHQYGLNETFGPYVVCEEQAEWLQQDSESRTALRARQGVAGIHVGSGLRVVAADGREVPADGKTSGEIVMSGNTVALGYYGAEAETARAFAAGWFHSGDLAVVHPDGYLEVKDRIKDLIYVETDYGWENISSIEVENVLEQCPGVSDVALLGVPSPDARPGASLVAVIEPDMSCPPSSAELREFCERRLPLHMRPSRFLFSTIPKTATGKTRKDLLVASVQADLAAAAPLASAGDGDGDGDGESRHWA
jgi:fatty-acyl-CoA synthase